jgi:endoglucanase
MRAFYLWRCGTEVFGVHQGDTFSHAACHLEDAWYDFTEFGEMQRDGKGGWHDAGDYGKYVTNAGITVANLFLAWEHFGNKIEHFPLDIPSTAPEMPEFLQELKWETDYLLKMEYPDGSGRVSHKLTRTNFSGFIMPEEDDAKRYFTNWGTNAVANFAATMAMASRYFEPYNTAYAQRCLEAAKRAYQFLENHPEYKRWEQGAFSTGGYQTHDSYARLWAATEMWETTGELKYLEDFESQVQQFETIVGLNWDWGNVKNLGIFRYLLSDKQGRNETIYEHIKSELIAMADTITRNTKTDVFGRPFDLYYWGCNGTVARLAITLGVAHRIAPNAEYPKAAQAIVAHLFGRNYYGRSYVTGLGINPPMHPHSRRSGADDVEAPWPGYLVGGGHSATDWVDKEESYSHNEIAINWQAPLVYVLAWFMGE